jgi:hypothetical protein
MFSYYSGKLKPIYQINITDVLIRRQAGCPSHSYLFGFSIILPVLRTFGFFNYDFLSINIIGALHL